MSTAGAGTTECQADWTTESVIDDYIADNKLSRRKCAYLEMVFENIMETISQAYSFDMAGSYYCSALELPQGSYKCQCIAAALDFVKPDRDRLGRDRLTRLNNELVECGYLDPEDADAYER